MQSILLPTDYSKDADNAFFYALSLANQFGVKLYVLYTYTLPVLSSVHAGQPELLDSVYSEIEDSKKNYANENNLILVNQAKQQNLDTSHISFYCKHGTLLDCVRETIQEHNISLVVMGVHGSNSIANKVIGSNTSLIIRNTNLPVLAIPIKAKFKPIQKIAFTTHFREIDLPALEEIMQISNIINANVYCVHVNNKNTDPSQSLLESQKWMKKFKDSYITFEFIEKNTNIEHSVNNYIMNNDIDILAIVKRNRSFFNRLINSSLSEQLTFHSEIPIFVFFETKD